MWNSLFVVMTVALGLVVLFQWSTRLHEHTHHPEWTDYRAVQRWLRHGSSLDSLMHSRLPLLWVHIPYESNSREWLNFGSRRTTELNQPYLMVTLQSILHHCSRSFRVVCIDDGSFARILPNWTLELSAAGEPVRSRLRQLAMAKVLSQYGGFQVPISFLCHRDMVSVYEEGIRDHSWFAMETPDRSQGASVRTFAPNLSFMGAERDHPLVRDWVHHLEESMTSDWTAQPTWEGTEAVWAEQHGLRLLSGQAIGTRTARNDPVALEDWFDTAPVSLAPSCVGVWIPHEELRRRTQWSWFLRMTPTDLWTSPFALAQAFRHALPPDSLGVAGFDAPDETRSNDA
jgi:hypothetical protein